jgi:hypothetical protein
MSFQEVRGVAQFNVYWREMKAKNLPFVVIESKSTLCTLKYDLFTCDKNLTDAAAESIHQLFYRILKIAPKRTWWFSFGMVNGYLPKIPIKLGREYLPRIAEIVNDPANWEAL